MTEEELAAIEAMAANLAEWGLIENMGELDHDDGEIKAGFARAVAEVRRLREELAERERERTAHWGQGFVNSAGLYTDADGRTHPLRE